MCLHSIELSVTCMQFHIWLISSIQFLLCPTHPTQSLIILLYYFLTSFRDGFSCPAWLSSKFVQSRAKKPQTSQQWSSLVNSFHSSLIGIKTLLSLSLCTCTHSQAPTLKPLSAPASCPLEVFYQYKLDICDNIFVTYINMNQHWTIKSNTLFRLSTSQWGKECSRHGLLFGPTQVLLWCSKLPWKAPKSLSDLTSKNITETLSSQLCLNSRGKQWRRATSAELWSTLLLHPNLFALGMVPVTYGFAGYI